MFAVQAWQNCDYTWKPLSIFNIMSALKQTCLKLCMKLLVYLVAPKCWTIPKDLSIVEWNLACPLTFPCIPFWSTFVWGSPLNILGRKGWVSFAFFNTRRSFACQGILAFGCRPEAWRMPPVPAKWGHTNPAKTCECAMYSPFSSLRVCTGL